VLRRWTSKALPPPTTSHTGADFRGRFSRGEEIVEEFKSGDEERFVHLEDCLNVQYGWCNSILKVDGFREDPVIVS
jgi:hypothetical protein